MFGRIETYDEFVSMYLNLEWCRVADIYDQAEAIRLGTDRATMPGSWIDLLANDERERALWRVQEFRKEL